MTPGRRRRTANPPPGLAAAPTRNEFSVCLPLAERAAMRHRRRRACRPGDEYSMWSH